MDVSRQNNASWENSASGENSHFIHDFFRRIRGVRTRWLCDKLISDRTGTDLRVCRQGRSSYTITSGGRIFQFRKASAGLNLELIGLARVSYGQYIPRSITHLPPSQFERQFDRQFERQFRRQFNRRFEPQLFDQLFDQSLVYESTSMSGIPLQLLWSTLKPDERAAMLDQVVKDLAKYVAPITAVIKE